MFVFPASLDFCHQVQQRPKTCKPRISKDASWNVEANRSGKDHVKNVLQSAVERLKIFLSSEKIQQRQVSEEDFDRRFLNVERRSKEHVCGELQDKKREDNHLRGGWIRKKSRRSGKPYYLNILTKQTQWSIPSELQ